MSEVSDDAVLSDSEGEEETHNEEDEVQVCLLTKETISEGLSLLCHTGNGLGHAFVRLVLKDKQLSDITAISCYIHIRFLDVSNNHLTDLSPLASLTHLLWLKADSNAVACLEGQPFAPLAYLQWLNMAANRLADLDGLGAPALESLNLSGNRIHSLSGLQSASFANLVTLELRGNKLDTTGGINIPSLRHLYLAKNVIRHLEGLEKLERLTTLHLRNNQLDSLDGLSPNMKALSYLNVRDNAIDDERALESLRLVSKTLRILVMSDNPLVEMTEHRLTVLTLLPQMKRIDKDLVSPEERSEAQERIKELEEQQRANPQDV